MINKIKEKKIHMKMSSPFSFFTSHFPFPFQVPCRGFHEWLRMEGVGRHFSFFLSYGWKRKKKRRGEEERGRDGGMEGREGGREGKKAHMEVVTIPQRGSRPCR